MRLVSSLTTSNWMKPRMPPPDTRFEVSTAFLPLSLEMRCLGSRNLAAGVIRRAKSKCGGRRPSPKAAIEQGWSSGEETELQDDEDDPPPPRRPPPLAARRSPPVQLFSRGQPPQQPAPAPLHRPSAEPSESSNRSKSTLAEQQQEGRLLQQHYHQKTGHSSSAAAAAACATAGWLLQQQQAACLNASLNSSGPVSGMRASLAHIQHHLRQQQQATSPPHAPMRLPSNAPAAEEENPIFPGPSVAPTADHI